MSGEVWTVLDERGGQVVNSTSFISLDVRGEGRALTYPVENGAFASYNKVETSLAVRVTLASQGDPAELELILNRLGEFRRAALKLTVATPDAVYSSLTLESYNYTRAVDNGAGLLAVELELTEVREVQSGSRSTVISSPKNPSSQSKEDTGKTQPIGGSILQGLINSAADSVSAAVGRG